MIHHDIVDRTSRHAQRITLTLICLSLTWTINVTALLAQQYKPIPRRLPPLGIVVPVEVQKKLAKQLHRTELNRAKLKPLKSQAHLLHDIDIYTTAVRYALENNEFYAKSDFKIAMRLLETAQQRIVTLRSGKPNWQKQKGLLVRGFQSQLDGSVQPFGLEIPEKLDLSKPVPLYVWLHGRGDKNTELKFIHQRENRKGKFQPKNAIVLHPFARHCNGFKLAGEIDVLEAVDEVCRRYPIDRDRIVLMGFSMGGGGCWHIGAKYPDRWCAIFPGAGFAETALYTRLKKSQYPPIYEQKLWQMNDTPGYVSNLFNNPVVAYSGEIDKQMQAATVMQAAFKNYSRKLPHIIGPGMGHKYHPDAIIEISKLAKTYSDKGINRWPDSVWLQTPTLKYNRARWLEILSLEQHWQDSLMSAQVNRVKKTMTVELKNINRFAVHRYQADQKISPLLEKIKQVSINDQSIEIPANVSENQQFIFEYKNNRWQLVQPENDNNNNTLQKVHDLQGPIDDAFTKPFLVVTPTGQYANPKIQKWVEFELAHFQDRWKRIFRGQLRTKKDTAVTAEDMQNYHLILWGDAASNSIIKKTISKLPIQWGQKTIIAGKKKYDTKNHALIMIYPNPLNRKKYIVINSGFTFREAHDRTNSLQNPKLPDWAIIDINTPPDANQSGKVVDANFFDEQWRLKK